MVLLRYLGTEGSGASNSNQRNGFRMGHGTAETYRKRVVTAIQALKDEFVTWPKEEERKAIARRIEELDGTLFPLAFTPETEDAPDYKGNHYSLVYKTAWKRPPW